MRPEASLNEKVLEKGGGKQTRTAATGHHFWLGFLQGQAGELEGREREWKGVFFFKWWETYNNNNNNDDDDDDNDDDDNDDDDALWSH